MSETEKHIDAAIQLEQKGIEFYSDMTEKSEHEYAKLMFKRLADDEKDHKSVLEALKQKLPESSEKAESLEPINADEIFSKREENLEFTKDYASALAFAVETEEESIKVYEKLRDTSEEMKDIFEMLVKFEQGHKEVLEIELEYVESVMG
jgi:rubrerythrin